MKISPSLLMFAPQRNIELALHWPPPQLLPPYTGQIQCRRGREKSTVVCIYNRNTSIWRTFFFIHLHIPDTVLFCPRWVNKFTLLDFKMILALLLLTRPWLARLRVTRHHSSSFPETCFLSFFSSCFGRRLKADWASVHQPNSTSHQRRLSAAAAPPYWVCLPLRCQSRLSPLNLSSGLLKWV